MPETWLFTNEFFVEAWQFMDDTIGYKSELEDLPNDRWTFQPVDPKQLRPDAQVSSTLQDRYTLNEEWNHTLQCHQRIEDGARGF